MNKIMTYENLRKFTYSNDKICTKPIKGIVLAFFGLRGSELYDYDTKEAQYYAEKGIIYLMPYYNPWAWMNRLTVKYVDEILDVVKEHYNLGDDIPLVSTGRSMGGYGAMIYSMRGKYHPIACAANCPACDLVTLFKTRDDTPMAMCSAFYGEEGDLEDILRDNSTINLVDQLPKIPYYIFQCDADAVVIKEINSDVLVSRMQGKHDVTYYVDPGQPHCDLSEGMYEIYHKTIADCVLNR